MKRVLTIAGMVIREIFRKKDFYVALILIVAILFYASQMRFFDTSKVSLYLMEIGLLLIYLFSVILTVSLAARQYPNEIQSRTALVLLAKPVSRFEFILGKFLGVLLAGWSAFTLFYGVFLVTLVLKGGSFSAVLALQAYYLFLLNIMLVAAMASCLSYVTTISANTTLSLVLYLLINSYGAGLRESAKGLFWLSRGLAEAFYFLLPHFEFFDLRQRFIHEWGVLSLSLLGSLTLYAVFYTAVFLSISYGIFRRRAI